MERLLLRADEVAALLGVSERGIYRLAAEGKIPATCVVKLGRSVRFSKLRLLAWLGQQEDGQREDGHDR